MNRKEETQHGGGSASVRETANSETSSGPTLAENETEANRMLYAGRGSVALRESNIYDKERLLTLPLFEGQGRLF